MSEVYDIMQMPLKAQIEKETRDIKASNLPNEDVPRADFRCNLKWEGGATNIEKPRLYKIELLEGSR